MQSNPERVLLNALRGMAYFDNRFGKPVAGAFPAADAQMAQLMFTAPLFKRVPTEKRDVVAQTAAKKLLREWKACPSPAELRQVLAESILAVEDKTTSSLYEMAKRFVAIPPVQQAEADRWENQLIYSAVRACSRDVFHTVSPENWSRIVVDILVGDLPWLTFQVVHSERPVHRSRDFASLLKKGGMNVD